MENAFSAEPALTWDQRCALIAEAGFAGVYAVPYPLTDDHLPRLRTLGDAPARCGLTLAGVYANLDLALPADAPAVQRLNRLFAEVDGAPRIELSVKCSDPVRLPAQVNDGIVARLEPLLALAERRSLRVALYPHSFYPLDSLAMAADLVARFGSGSLGYVFPTSHLYALHLAETVVAQLAAHAAAIMSFNVCGCRRVSAWPPAACHHLPLGEGELGLTPLFRQLALQGYHGEVIVQGHGWSGNPRVNLAASAAAYARLVAAVGPAPEGLSSG